MFSNIALSDYFYCVSTVFLKKIDFFSNYFCYFLINIICCIIVVICSELTAHAFWLIRARYKPQEHDFYWLINYSSIQAKPKPRVLLNIACNMVIKITLHVLYICCLKACNNYFLQIMSRSVYHVTISQGN
jgi:hypothetical protein